MHSSTHGWFVTGTDTNVGKTLASSALLHALGQAGFKAVGMKPVASGTELKDGRFVNEDVEQLRAASTVDAPIEARCPYLFRAAIAPHLAAAAECRTIDIGTIMSAYDGLAQHADAVVVEGVGGFVVPLSGSLDTADLAQRLDLPVILVVGIRLGCLSHALLTAEAIRTRGLRLAGWIASSIDPNMLAAAANIDTLMARLDAPLLGHIPHLPDSPPEQQRIAAAGHLDISSLLAGLACPDCQTRRTAQAA